MTTPAVQAEPVAASASVGAPQPVSLLPRMLHSALWLFNGSLFVRGLSLARGIILARLLLPDDFGLFGLASVVVGFTLMFSDVGAGVFLVYRQDKVEDHADTAFWANLGVATILATGVAATAPLVGRFYSRPDVVPVLAVLALSLWLLTAFTVHRNLLRRELRFRSLAVIDAAVNLASFGIAVALAWKGYGVWAFVLSNLLGNAISGLLFWCALRWIPRWRFSWHSLRVLAPFSGWYLGQALVWYLAFNVDNLLVGKFLGIGALGIYGLAYNYALFPVTVIAGSLGSVGFAELPRLHGRPSEFWPAYFQSSKLLAGAVCPIAAALLVSAPDLFPVLFGSKWNDAILPFQILTVYGAIRCLWMDPFAALGRFDLGFRMALSTALLSFLGIYLGLPYGKSGVAWAVLIVVGGGHVGSLYVASNSASRLMQGLRNAAPYFATAGGAAILAFGVRHWLLAEVTGRKELLALCSLATVLAVYTLVFQRQLRSLAMVFIKMGVGRTS